MEMHDFGTGAVGRKMAGGMGRGEVESGAVAAF
jgi:hypothetical protein